MLKNYLNFKKTFVAFGILITTMGMVGCNNDDDNTNKKTPNIENPKTDEEVILGEKISSGYRHSIAITPEGKLMGWGNSESGELAEKSSMVTPKIISEDQWSSISCGYNSTLGIKKDGSLWAVGYNNIGQLGLDNTEDAEVFTQVGTENNWKKVQLGYRHAIGLKKDGTIWAWGSNEFLQLGNGTDIPSIKPVQVGNENDWVDIAAGHSQSFAIKKDGTLWAWGYNYYGQLGINTKINMGVPTKVASDLKWKTVVTGISFTGGIKEDGSLWMWGRNYHGQLGDGKGNLSNDSDTQIPVKIESNIPWKKISLGNGHVLALKNDNTLWSWGKNMSGELGIGGETGYTVYKNTPTKINEDTDWEDISAGEYFSVVKKKDNSYWAFGTNKKGQIISDKDEENIPIKIF